MIYSTPVTGKGNKNPTQKERNETMKQYLEPQQQFRFPDTDRGVDFLLRLLEGRDWMKASEILHACAREDTENNHRAVRAIANASGGAIGSGQKGYKLVKHMTLEEFTHYCNAMTNQAVEMERRVIESKHIWNTRPQ